MIIANGTLEFKTKSETGINPETGYPVKPSQIWSKPIQCQYYINRSNMLARVGTEAANKVSYTILIEEQAQSESIRLKKLDGTTVGEFSVESIEQLDAVCQTKIIV